MPTGTTGTLLAGRYRVLDRLGSGGMAAVLLAEDERLGRRVAIKRLHAESPEHTAQRFRREARLGASLNHPNLVAVYDIDFDDEGVLIAMEYVEGETLRDALDRGPLEPRRTVEVVRALAAALDQAHGQGIVHRDVKPANVLLGRDGRIKLADLGIATAFEGTKITRSGTVLGTAAYMAPEQLEGHRSGPAADVYALAVVAWESLSGRRAYQGRTPIEIAHRKAAEPPPALDEAWPGAPRAAVRLLARAMGPDAAARPVTAGQLADELASALEPERERGAPLTGRPSPVAARAPRVGPAQPSRSRWAAPLAVLLMVAVLAAGALFALTGGGDSKRPDGDAASAGKQGKSSEASGHAQSRQPTEPEQPAAPEPAAPAEQPAPEQPASGYQVPQPAGDSAAAGARLNAKGKALSDGGDYDAAIPVLERALRSYPAGTTAAGNLQFAYALFNLGHALTAAGRPADAIPVLEERAKNPDQSATVQRELDAARAAAAQG